MTNIYNKDTHDSTNSLNNNRGISAKFLEQSVQQLVRILGEPNHNYKDRIFRMLVSDKRVALEIYNAMNDTHYDNPDELIITTLENAIYMGMKNDVSFIISSQLVLYEHQSTINPNMPLRDLFYVACVYSTLVIDKNLYGKKQILLPEPRFVVFYNGTEKVPERYKMRLSDAFEHKSEDIALELTIEVININYGHNPSLLEKCPTLQQYAIYVDTVRKYQESEPFAVAVEHAIDECIAKNVLADFLRKNRAEVLRMSLFYYDEEKHIQQERDESYEDGKREGKEEGIQIGELKGRILVYYFDMKLPIKDIAEKVNTSEETIKKIIDEDEKQR